MRTIDAIAQILKMEGVQYLSAFPTTPIIEAAARSGIPICTVVLNNSSMACEADSMATSHRLFNTRDLGGNYADMGAAMGGWSERVVDPAEIGPAILRARKATQEGKAALLEFITKQQTKTSHKRAFE